jgi:hypothetical protein
LLKIFILDFKRAELIFKSIDCFIENGPSVEGCYIINKFKENMFEFDFLQGGNQIEFRFLSEIIDCLEQFQKPSFLGIALYSVSAQLEAYHKKIKLSK